MDAADTRAYVERGWAVAAALKGEHWAREFQARGPDATLAVSLALHAQMCRLYPDWPSAEERRADLAHHLALKRAIDRAAGVGTSVAPR